MISSRSQTLNLLVLSIVLTTISAQVTACKFTSGHRESRLMKRSVINGIQAQRVPSVQVKSNQIHFPQQVQTLPRWSAPGELLEPVNVPTIINQEEARYLERYMKNHAEQQAPLDLASINDRAPSSNPPTLPAPRSQQPSGSSQVTLFGLPAHSEPTSTFTQSNPQQRSDQTTSRHDLVETMMVKKGKVEDVMMPRSIKYPPSPANSKHQLVSNLPLHHKSAQLLDKYSLNCISRSANIAARCEDHLVKRLSQDVTEGRTVIDVGRRHCCALFWHKDCISRVVVDNCPDSSPAVANVLMGNRLLDLTHSCQRFNRDGCNGSLGNINISLTQALVSCILGVLIYSLFES